MSVVPLMAAALDRELRERFNFALHRGSCEAIIGAVIAGTAAIARATESSQPALPPGRPPDGRCTPPSDASAVAFSSSAMPAPRTSDGGRAPSGAAPAVTPAQQAYGLLWRDIRCESAAACKARHILLRSLAPVERADAIAWVRREHPFKDGEITS